MLRVALILLTLTIAAMAAPANAVRINLATDLDGAGANESRDYGYDANGRLLTASGPWGSGGANATGSFKYDALGNLREQKLGTRTIAIDYDPATNRAWSFRDTALGGNALNTLAYDVRGNMTDTGTSSLGRPDLTYDHSNQPVSVSGSATATYVYDGNLKRVKEVRGGKTIYNVFSKVTGGLIYRFDDATGTANDIRTDYVNVGGAALRLKKTGAGGFVAEYTHFDSQGSAVAATDAAGTVTWRERYAPFGEELLKPAANDNNTAYTGHLKDDATGLNYMQARYYDPIIGRFLSTDPIGYQDQLNLYAYVHNDPVNAVDPNGEVTVTLGLKFKVPNLFNRNAPDVKQFGVEGGVALSIPIPGIDPEGTKFDLGVFGEASADAGFGIGGTGKATVELGVSLGDVQDMNGRGGEVSVQVPVTPIPGTPIPNPIGPSVGGGVQLDEDGNVNGIKLSAGVGSEVSGGETFTKTFSIQDLFEDKE